MATDIITTPIKIDDPYSEFKGVCEWCGKWIYWAETCLTDEFGLMMYHIDCEKAYVNY